MTFWTKELGSGDHLKIITTSSAYPITCLSSLETFDNTFRVSRNIINIFSCPLYIFFLQGVSWNKYKIFEIESIYRQSSLHSTAPGTGGVYLTLLSRSIGWHYDNHEYFIHVSMMTIVLPTNYNCSLFCFLGCVQM